MIIELEEMDGDILVVSTDSPRAKDGYYSESNAEWGVLVADEDIDIYVVTEWHNPKQPTIQIVGPTQLNIEDTKVLIRLLELAKNSIEGELRYRTIQAGNGYFDIPVAYGGYADPNKDPFTKKARKPICEIAIEDCLLWQECKYHETAGDYRSESGVVGNLNFVKGRWRCTKTENPEGEGCDNE